MEAKKASQSARHVYAADEREKILADAASLGVCANTNTVGDFGGGTSDFTVLQMHDKLFQPTEVLAIGGVSVAGDAFDSAIMRRHVGKHFGTYLKRNLNH